MALSRARIDKLGDVLRDGVFGKEALIELDEFRNEFVAAYENVVYKLKDQLGYQVTGRPAKSTPAIVEKLRRETTRLSQMQDIAGCRVIVTDMPMQERALAAIRVFLIESDVYDRRESPSHGYRAVHIVSRNEPRRVEVQLRTVLQHMWAEVSEKYADTVDPRIKYGEGDESVLRLLNSLSVSISRIEADELERDKVLKVLKSAGRKAPPKIRRGVKEIDKRFLRQRAVFMQSLHQIQQSFGST